MDTIKNQPVHFGAKLINNVNIKKFNPKSHLYDNAKASFVEFEPKNQADMMAIISKASEWRGEPYAGDIAQNASYITNGIISGNTNHIYLLTTQQSNLEKMKPGKILGMAHMCLDDGKNELKFLQVDPKLKYGASKKRFKNLGAGILNSLKELYKDSIELESEFKTAKFYEKQGFKAIGQLRYRWEA